MFKLLLQDIHLGASAQDKTQAIEKIASALAEAGYAEAGYADGMIKREKQASTYLGNGIAIPHGTLDARRFVKQTGIQVFQFPKGVVWGDEEQLAYVAIGISASSDEHLTLLRQLTHVLSKEGIQEKLAAVTTAEELRSILQGETSEPELLFNNSLISLNISGDSFLILQALNAGNLQKTGAVNADFIAEVMSQKPVHLGQGIWLNDSHHGNILSAIAISRPIKPICEQDKSVKMLITVSVASDKTIQLVLDKLASLLLIQNVDELLHADAAGLLALLNSSEDHDGQGISAEFVVTNSHGLHTRPGSMLVKVIKDFKSIITVANLDGSGKPVNGSSLMKVVALGAKKGHRLRFTAVGDDAELALSAIGKAMVEGLGEDEQ